MEARVTPSARPPKWYVLGRPVWTISKNLDVRVGAIDAKLDHQGRYVFLVLALIAAVGLYGAVAPHVSSRSSGTTDAAAAPAAETSAGRRNDPLSAAVVVRRSRLNV